MSTAMMWVDGMRNRKAALKAMRELDAFPKVAESFVETTTSGAAISITTVIAICFLVVSEFQYYSESKIRLRYDVDTDFDAKLKINVDITVGMPCDSIGADILDATDSSADTFGSLKEEKTWFELTPRQRIHWDTMQQVNNYIRQESHSLQELLWKSGYENLFGQLPPRETSANESPDSCRLSGTLQVNKLAGNFHITAGKYLPHPRGHAHLSVFMDERDYNFSHRIERFSFGDAASGIVDPLDGDEKISSKHFQMYQYFIKVVPTEVNTFSTQMKTFQYSVTEQEREISHMKGSHGVPGIYFKYDMSSLKVQILEEHEPITQFLVRLCGIVGGVFSTSGILNMLVGYIIDAICCRLERRNAIDSTRNTSDVDGSEKLQTVDLMLPPASGLANGPMPVPAVPANNFAANELLNGDVT